MHGCPDTVGRHAPRRVECCVQFGVAQTVIEDQLTQEAMTKANNSKFPSSFESDTADLAEAQMRLAAASEAASENLCVQVASDHEVSVKAFAEVLKALDGVRHRFFPIRDFRG